jgi:hypothetical protein
MIWIDRQGPQLIIARFLRHRISDFRKITVHTLSHESTALVL